jgi:hypothetical protein
MKKHSSLLCRNVKKFYEMVDRTLTRLRAGSLRVPREVIGLELAVTLPAQMISIPWKLHQWGLYYKTFTAVIYVF